MLLTAGNVIGGITSRRGTILDSEVRDDEFTVTAEVALNDMFGYSSQLRGQTQGKGEFSMEYKVRLSGSRIPLRSLTLTFSIDACTCTSSEPEGTRRGLQEVAAPEKVAL